MTNIWVLMHPYMIHPVKYCFVISQGEIFIVDLTVNYAVLTDNSSICGIFLALEYIDAQSNNRRYPSQVGRNADRRV